MFGPHLPIIDIGTETARAFAECYNYLRQFEISDKARRKREV
jgi:hypothetical protein